MNIVRLNTTAPDGFVKEGNGNGGKGKSDFVYTLSEELSSKFLNTELSSAEILKIVEDVHEKYPMILLQNKGEGLCVILSLSFETTSDEYAIHARDVYAIAPAYDNYGDEGSKFFFWGFHLGYDYTTQEGVIEQL